MVEKIARLQQLKQQRGLSFLIEVDGSCMTSHDLPEIARAGAQVLILGSSGFIPPGCTTFRHRTR